MAKKNRRSKGGEKEKGSGAVVEAKPTDVKAKADAKARAEIRARAHARAQTDQPDGTVGEWVKSLLVAGVLFLVIRTFILQTFVITSGSMENALLVGDFLIANRAAVGVRIPGTQLRIPGYSAVRRGDVLVFDPPHEPDLKLVKRLIGMPGDTVSMKDAVLTLNGQIQDEPYIKHVDPAGDDPHAWMSWQADNLVNSVSKATYRPTRDNWGPLVIPEDRYFMLGDNRDTSLDSRYWGLLEGWRIEGRASIIYFSYNKGSFRPFPWLREVRGGRIISRIR
jgi:signal peptidase I